MRNCNENKTREISFFGNIPSWQSPESSAFSLTTLKLTKQGCSNILFVRLLRQCQ